MKNQQNEPQGKVSGGGKNQGTQQGPKNKEFDSEKTNLKGSKNEENNANDLNVKNVSGSKEVPQPDRHKHEYQTPEGKPDTNKSDSKSNKTR